MSGATLAEALVVAHFRGVSNAMTVLLSRLPVTVHPVDAAAGMRAAQVYPTWGKGVHPARLNLMDCFAYALAVDRGNDFACADVVAALSEPH